MGFLDKIKGIFAKIKEDNKYFALTTARLNNKAEYYGWANYSVKDGDFRIGSYINIEKGKGVIYSTGDEGYFFTAEDIASFSFVGDGQPVNQDKIKVPTLRFATTFKDGKKANIDIICTKVDAFKAVFGL